MEKCSPVEMRKNLEVVRSFSDAGIDFVAIPVQSSEHKEQLIMQGHESLAKMADIAEAAEGE